MRRGKQWQQSEIHNWNKLQSQDTILRNQGGRSDMKHQNGCLHKTHCLHPQDFNHVQGKKLLV